MAPRSDSVYGRQNGGNGDSDDKRLDAVDGSVRLGLGRRGRLHGLFRQRRPQRRHRRNERPRFGQNFQLRRQDSDADGTLDANEGGGDSDSDSVREYVDCDTDGDGISDALAAGCSATRTRRAGQGHRQRLCTRRRRGWRSGGGGGGGTQACARGDNNYDTQAGAGCWRSAAC